MQSESVIVGDEVDGDTEVTEPSAPTNPVQVGLSHLGEVEVDDHVDGLDVNTASEEVTADQIPAQTGAEIVENSVTMSLEDFFH